MSLGLIKTLIAHEFNENISKKKKGLRHLKF